MANTLFKPNERLLVEEKFLDTAAYEFLKGACERSMNEGCNEGLAHGEGKLLVHGESKARLHPAELFYQCFIILDTLKCKSPTLRVAYCNERVWDELLGYFRDNGFSWPLAELHLIIGCIMQGAAELLLRAGREHLSEVAALKRQIQRHAPLSGRALDQAYRSSLRSMDEEKLVCMMDGYMEAEEKMYSDDINALLDELEKTEVSSEKYTSGEYEVSAASVSSVRIARQKKTSVLVVLNAMFKAGWFVAEDGSELKNRDVALNDVLRHAFAIDKYTAISQTINPSNNINAGQKNQRLLHLLLDEDEMERYIKDLQQELLDAYEERE